MKRLILLGLCIILELGVGFILLKSRSLPVTKLWHGYDALYVQNSVQEESVLEYLYDSGCKDVIAHSNQQFPYDVSKIDLYPLAKDVLEDTSFANGYIKERDKYFCDKEGNFSIYYVPSEYHNKALLAIKSLVATKKGEAASKGLTASPIRVGFDCAEELPISRGLLVVAAALVLCILAEHRLSLVFLAILPCVAGFCFPYYTFCSSLVFLIFSSFLMLSLLYRPKFILALKRNVVVLFFMLLPVPFIVSIGLKALLAYLAITVCNIVASISLGLVKGYFDERSSFNPVYIFNALAINVMSTKTRRLMALPCLIALTMLTLEMLGPRAFASTTGAISLPAPNSASFSDSEELVSFDSYAKWCYMIECAPYRRYGQLPSVPEYGTKLVFPRYAIEDNRIVETNDVVISYDKEYIQKVKERVLSLDYPAIEKLLVLQDSKASVTYTTTVQASTGNKAEPLVLIVLVLLPPLFYLMIRKRLVLK